MVNIISTIRNSLETLKTAERRVAACVLKSPNAIIEATITDVAEMAEVSEPTVVRFCRTIGLKGYMDLRLNLAKDVPSSPSAYETVTDSDSPIQVLEKTLTCHQEELQNLLNKIDIPNFKKAVALLSKAKRLDIYGFGGSGLLAKEAWHKFFRLGIPCNTYKDAHLHLMGASLLDKDSVVLAITLEGSAMDLIESVGVAKKTGAKIIGITGSKRTPLDRLCDVVFPLICKEPAPWIYRLSTRVAQMAFLDALFISLMVQKDDKGKHALEKMKNSISVKSY